MVSEVILVGNKCFTSDQGCWVKKLVETVTSSLSDYKTNYALEIEANILNLIKSSLENVYFDTTLSNHKAQYPEL
jgi:hypothetical protein